VTGQQVIIPYAQSGDGYWSGVAITNTSPVSVTFTIGVYKSDAVWHLGTGPFTVEAHTMKVENPSPAKRGGVFVKVAAGITRTHNPFDEDYWASCLRETLTSSSYGEGLETGREFAQEPRQFLTRQTRLNIFEIDLIL
jgi:hypothetical protein